MGGSPGNGAFHVGKKPTIAPVMYPYMADPNYPVFKPTQGYAYNQVVAPQPQQQVMLVPAQMPAPHQQHQTFNMSDRQSTFDGSSQCRSDASGAEQYLPYGMHR